MYILYVVEILVILSVLFYSIQNLWMLLCMHGMHMRMWPSIMRAIP